MTNQIKHEGVFPVSLDRSLMPLRIGIGILFVVLGLTELITGPGAFGVSNFGWMGSAAVTAGWVFALVELFGGVALLLNRLVPTSLMLLGIVEIILILSTDIMPIQLNSDWSGLVTGLAVFGGMLTYFLTSKHCCACETKSPHPKQ